MDKLDTVTVRESVNYQMKVYIWVNMLRYGKVVFAYIIDRSTKNYKQNM
jgi:hypothetical protein